MAHILELHELIQQFQKSIYNMAISQKKNSQMVLVDYQLLVFALNTYN